MACVPLFILKVLLNVCQLVGDLYCCYCVCSCICGLNGTGNCAVKLLIISVELLGFVIAFFSSLIIALSVRPCLFVEKLLQYKLQFWNCSRIFLTSQIFFFRLFSSVYKYIIHMSKTLIYVLICVCLGWLAILPVTIHPSRHTGS